MESPTVNKTGYKANWREAMRKLLSIGVAVFVLSVFGAACSKAADEPKEGLEVGDRFPHYDTFAAKTIDGEDITFNSHKGSLLFIDFWASWCGPCREELPYLAIVQSKYAGDKFGIIGISLDKSIDSLREMAKEFGLTYSQICDGKVWQSEYAKMYGVQSIPTNFLLDGNGVILAKDMRGLVAEGEVAKALGLDNPIVKYTEALEYLMSTEKPDLDKALGMLDKALEGDPEQPEFHFMAARLQFAKGDAEKATEHLEAGLKHKDKLPVFMPALQAYVMLGRGRLDAGDKDGAVEMIDEAIKAINALDEKKKEAYSPYIEQLEQLKEQWKSGNQEK
jgi:thiol-disulfide isomerase/thioredoxin